MWSIFPGSVYPLEAALKNGGSRDQPTTATLTITPTKDDDEAIFRCEVWNRALSQDKLLTATVSLSVQCKYNFIDYFQHSVLNFILNKRQPVQS